MEDYSSDSDTPHDVREAANAVVSNMLPEKSKGHYEKVYSEFRGWYAAKEKKRKSQKNCFLHIWRENLVNLNHLLHGAHSMLKNTMNIKGNIDATKFPKFIPYLNTERTCIVSCPECIEIY